MENAERLTGDDEGDRLASLPRGGPRAHRSHEHMRRARPHMNRIKPREPPLPLETRGALDTIRRRA